jgi:predicted DNA-binding transcriptional regulator YafY
MRHDKLERELNLLLLLIENHNYTVQDICDRMSISRRNFYYYIEFFRLAGFIVDNHKPYYRIRKDSPFFRKLDAAVHITEDEAILLRRLLNKVGNDHSPQMQRLIQKFDRLYDLDIVNSVEIQQRAAHNASTLYEAIKRKCCVVLKNYSSPHSNTVSDRLVEPFLFMNANQEIRCYELASGMNKTFKISRMQDVALLDLLWEHEHAHKQIFTDVFMFSSEPLLPVTLRLGRLSRSVLIEEYPQAEKFVEPDGDSHWIVRMDVCSHIGVGRFVMGLFEDIDVLGDERFKAYIKAKIEQINHKQQQNEKD